jgi:hypothetical protein
MRQYAIFRYFQRGASVGLAVTQVAESEWRGQKLGRDCRETLDQHIGVQIPGGSQIESIAYEAWIPTEVTKNSDC